MQRLILTLFAVISLLLGVSAAIGSQPAPAQAGTTIPLYGAPAYVDGSPIGGGVGYLNIIEPSQADYVVSTAATLKSTLASATSGQIVYIADGATITIDSNDDMYSLTYVDSATGIAAYVKAGVTLAAGRGRPGVTGGRIYIDPTYAAPNRHYTVGLAAGARLTGVTIEGPYSGTSSAGTQWSGVRCVGNNVEIDNNVIFNCPKIGIYAAPPNVTNTWVHHNYIHHCQMAGMGYGVLVGADNIYHVASAIVEGNMFDYLRHAMCGGRGRSSWTFRYNSLGANCWGNNADSHGNNDADYQAKDGDEYIYCAGENIDIYNNTSLTTVDNFVYIRGTPYSTGSISVHNNWSYNTRVEKVCQHLLALPEYAYDATLDNQPAYPFVRMSVYDNWFGTTPPPSTNVAPVLNAIGNKSIKERARLSFTMSASDANGDALTYSASNLPVGATFDPATRTFSWTPGLSQAGVYAGVHFQVSDGQMTDYEDITITVSDGVQADVNSDGAVNSLDMIRVGQHWNETGESGWIPEDINKDGTVNVLDATLVGQHWTG
jgi:hypothetical protein